MARDLVTNGDARVNTAHQRDQFAAGQGLQVHSPVLRILKYYGVILIIH